MVCLFVWLSVRLSANCANEIAQKVVDQFSLNLVDVLVTNEIEFGTDLTLDLDPALDLFCHAWSVVAMCVCVCVCVCVWLSALLGTVDFQLADGTVVFRTCDTERDKVVFQIVCCHYAHVTLTSSPYCCHFARRTTEYIWRMMLRCELCCFINILLTLYDLGSQCTVWFLQDLCISSAKTAKRIQLVLDLDHCRRCVTGVWLLFPL